MPVDHILTTCPYCGTGCNFFLQVAGGRVVDVVPCKTDETSAGRLCIKGYNAHAFVNHPDRLKHPMIRERDQLTKATWEDALKKIVVELKRISSEHGPDSIMVLASAKCTNEEDYMIQKIARVAIGTNNVDHCARLCHASTVAGLLQSFGSGAMTNTIPEFEEADCVLVTGSNTLEAHPLIGARILKAKNQGAKIVVVDPRDTPLSRVATISLRQEPGTDIAWINGMINVITSEGLHDKEFIETRTTGFDELQDVVKKYTPERVEGITGIPKDDLVSAARMYASADKAMIAYAMGITQHTNGTNLVRALANLAMITGNVGRESTGVNPLRGQCNVQGACDAGALPNLYPGYQSVEDADTQAKFEKAWGRKLSAKKGMTLTNAFNKALTGEVKAMLIFGENPMLSDPDIGHVEEAISKLEFMAVVDIFPTETAKLADVVLPAACYAEKDGTFTATDRAVRAVRKAVDPPEDARPDWQIACDLGRMLGGKGFDFDSPEQILAEMAAVAPIYGGIDYARIEKEMVRWPCPSKDHPGTKVLHAGTFKIGKGVLAPVEHTPPAEETSEEFPLILTTGRNLFHFHTGTMTRRSIKLQREAAGPYVEINSEDARKLGIADDASVRVSSPRGSITLSARVTPWIRPGTIFIPFHYAEAAANKLTNNVLDPIAQIPEYKVCAAKVEKA